MQELRIVHSMSYSVLEHVYTCTCMYVHVHTICILFVYLHLCVYIHLFLFSEGTVDAVTFSTGTGGTLAGVGMFLKSKNPNVKVVLADPQVRVLGGLIR